MRDIKNIVEQMTLEEKASLCSGENFWHTKEIERLGIPSFMLTDGPHGLRKQVGEADHVGINESVPATCFPAGVTLASSWDRNLVEQVGVALGEECQAENVGVLLGPGANIKRSPLCGRNFEYFSEDPYFSSQIAKSHINGVQSQGVGSSLKHFAANNQEYKRMTIDATIDERALREIYLASFEGAVKEAKPWTVMSAYNKLNGTFCSENHYLLTEILRDDWGFDGVVVSDWGAVNDRVDALRAGLELEMPSNQGMNDRKIIEAIEQGLLSEEVLNNAVEQLLNLAFKIEDNKKSNASFDFEEHHQLARKAASEGMILLKNEDHTLPLDKNKKIAFIGGFVKNPRIQGGGSSHIIPTKVDDVLEEIQRVSGKSSNIAFAEGYDLSTDVINEALMKEATGVAEDADVAVVFLGLPENYESEGYDRKHLNIPPNQTALLEAIISVQENIVVVLSNGSPIEMPWIGKVKSVLEAYLGGQAMGGAITDVLFGKVNPSGKLAETFPLVLSQNPSFINFPGEEDKVEYREGIFVGYRYYDKTETKTLFPFGHGLSYTTFAYSDLTVDKKELADDQTLAVSVKIINTGSRSGKEAVQLYVRDVESQVIRPVKELKGFEKVALEPGEEKIVNFTLGKRAFAYYNEQLKDWYVESGTFEILVGKSSAVIECREEVVVKSTTVIRTEFHRNSNLSEVLATPVGKELLKQMGMGQNSDAASDQGNPQMIMEMMKIMPLRSLVTLSSGKFTEEALATLIDQLNQLQSV